MVRSAQPNYFQGFAVIGVVTLNLFSCATNGTATSHQLSGLQSVPISVAGSRSVSVGIYPPFLGFRVVTRVFSTPSLLIRRFAWRTVAGLLNKGFALLTVFHGSNNITGSKKVQKKNLGKEQCGVHAPATPVDHRKVKSSGLCRYSDTVNNMTLVNILTM